jgi:hypothetical protein
MGLEMTKNNKSVSLALCPYLWRWATEIGTVEIGHCHQTRSFLRVLDEGGIVWKGRHSYYVQGKFARKVRNGYEEATRIVLAELTRQYPSSYSLKRVGGSGCIRLNSSRHPGRTSRVGPFQHTTHEPSHGNAGFIRQQANPSRALPDESGVPHSYRFMVAGRDSGIVAALQEPSILRPRVELPAAPQ